MVEKSLYEFFNLIEKFLPNLYLNTRNFHNIKLRVLYCNFSKRQKLLNIFKYHRIFGIKTIVFIYKSKISGISTLGTTSCSHIILRFIDDIADLYLETAALEVVGSRYIAFDRSMMRIKSNKIESSTVRVRLSGQRCYHYQAPWLGISITQSCDDLNRSSRGELTHLHIFS